MNLLHLKKASQTSSRSVLISCPLSSAHFTNAHNPVVGWLVVAVLFCRMRDNAQEGAPSSATYMLQLSKIHACYNCKRSVHILCTFFCHSLVHTGLSWKMWRDFRSPVPLESLLDAATFIVMVSQPSQLVGVNITSKDLPIACITWLFNKLCKNQNAGLE